MNKISPAHISKHAESAGEVIRRTAHTREVKACVTDMFLTLRLINHIMMTGMNGVALVLPNRASSRTQP